MTAELVSTWMLTRAGNEKFAGERLKVDGANDCVSFVTGDWMSKEYDGLRG